MSLTVTDRSTISKLLGLIGSARDAEALATARKAHKLVKVKGCTWPEALGLEEAPPAPPDLEHVAVARDLLKCGKGICSDLEMPCLRGILAFETLSQFQHQSLDGIWARCSPPRKTIQSRSNSRQARETLTCRKPHAVVLTAIFTSEHPRTLCGPSMPLHAAAA
jgi:hypothetical protein